MRRKTVRNGTSKDLQGKKCRVPELRKDRTLSPYVQNETARNKAEQNKHPKEGKCGSPKEPLDQFRIRIGGINRSNAHR